MAPRYFKRYRMEVDLDRVPLSLARLPDGYYWTAWNPADVDRHARVKFESFRTEVDAQVFPCLGDIQGCRRLMREIAGQRSFLSQSTWLITFAGNGHGPEDCGTIQGLAHSESLGAVQNVGVTPAHRGLGLGRALLLQALLGFRTAQMRRVSLEVTATNQPAIELYRSAGFRLVRTMYRAVEVEEEAIPAL